MVHVNCLIWFLKSHSKSSFGVFLQIIKSYTVYSAMFEFWWNEMATFFSEDKVWFKNLGQIRFGLYKLNFFTHPVTGQFVVVVEFKWMRRSKIEAQRREQSGGISFQLKFADAISTKIEQTKMNKIASSQKSSHFKE